MTPRLYAILMAAQQEYTRKGYPASIRELRAMTGCSSTSVTRDALHKLVHLGWITQTAPANGRCYRPVTLGHSTVNGRELPVFPLEAP